MIEGLTPHTAALIERVLETLRDDAGVQAFFGAPPRIFDADTERPAYPYAEIVSAQTRDITSALTPGGEHRLTFAVYVHRASRADVAEGLSALISAIQPAELSVPGGEVVLAHPVYLDVLRTAQPQILRGLLRLRIVTQQEDTHDE